MVRSDLDIYISSFFLFLSFHIQKISETACFPISSSSRRIRGGGGGNWDNRILPPFPIFLLGFPPNSTAHSPTIHLQASRLSKVRAHIFSGQVRKWHHECGRDSNRQEFENPLEISPEISFVITGKIRGSTGSEIHSMLECQNQGIMCKTRTTHFGLTLDRIKSWFRQ
jgi:hypothetical protein